MEMGTEEVAVDLYVIVEYGIPIQRAAADAQENVRKAIESMTGLHVVRVDVHVQSVSFEQDKKALQAGVQNAALAAGESEPETEQAKEPEKKPAAKPKAEPVKETPKKEAPAAKETKAKAEPALKTKKTPKKAEAAATPAEAGKKQEADKPAPEKTEPEA